MSPDALNKAVFDIAISHHWPLIGRASARTPDATQSGFKLARSSSFPEVNRIGDVGIVR